MEAINYCWVQGAEVQQGAAGSAIRLLHGPTVPTEAAAPAAPRRQGRTRAWQAHSSRSRRQALATP